MKKLIFFLILPFIALPALGGFAQEKIDLNTATSKELEGLFGVGPIYAQGIIDNRPFSSVDDLIKVKGIGEKTLEKIKEQGLAYVSKSVIEVEHNVILNARLPDGQEVKNPDNNDYGGVVFNEVLPSPEGSDSENEWIELYNSNDLEIDLSGWKIKDTTGSVKEHIIDNKIPASGYLILRRPETNITLNNDGDGLILLNPNEEVVDSITLGKAVQGQSYIKTSSEWTWTTTPTPNSQNLETSKKVEDGPRPSPALSLLREEELPEDARLPDGQGSRVIKLVKDLERSSKVSVVLVGFLIALCSSVAFLIIKNNLKNFWY